ncbi:aminotransferase-like domain-containing protein [Thauera sp. Sel9]|uniref:aminotransferase-like domain-containing protein n=1 Tax=Thauera sp. Sel9 TaxID=2974299 RepID=UPI0021E165B3|nr:PLP-dependent aminotransferase family protein [Thauera sp. Sel9]MCV2219630.1 PLP-dependent aminotransferase family protein [Thauera sp. Sel9]
MTAPAMSSFPLYQQIARKLRASIEAGTLPAGAKMPSVRTLGKDHGVSILTALQALRLLEQEHLVEARPKSGFYVAPQRDTLPAEARPIELAPLEDQAQTHLSIVGTPCRVRLDLANGEAALYPVAKLGILMRQLIYRDPTLLGNHVRGTGHPPLKQQIVRRAFDYGCELSPQELVITHGCIESLALALRAVTRPGDGVAVESPTYFVILQMLRSLGLRAVEISASERGMDLAQLKLALKAGQLRAVISIANINNPTGITLSPEDKSRLVALAERYDVALIEDDIYGDTHFDPVRPRPLRALSDKVILCSSFSKTLAPGIRVGWVAGGRWSSAIASMKYSSTMGTAIYPQAAIAEFLRTGGYDAHLRKLRHTLHKQMTRMRDAIIRHFPAGTVASNPSGGYVLWIRLPAGSLSSRRLFEQARREGIGIAPGYLFAAGGQFDDCIRLNAGFGWNKDVEHAIQTLAGMLGKPWPIRCPAEDW